MQHPTNGSIPYNSIETSVRASTRDRKKNASLRRLTSGKKKKRVIGSLQTPRFSGFWETGNQQFVSLLDHPVQIYADINRTLLKIKQGERRCINNTIIPGS
jgi:hypothetical protein